MLVMEGGPESGIANGDSTCTAADRGLHCGQSCRLPGEAVRILLEVLGMLFESVLFMWWSQEKGSRSSFPMQLQLVLSRRRLLWAVRMFCWASKVGK